MNEAEIVKKTEEYVRAKLEGEKGGHDWEHVHRVYLLAQRSALEEKADLFVVKLAALLHDIGEHGKAEVHTKSCAEGARKFLKQFAISEKKINHICDCILTHPWFDGIEKPKTIEAKIIADCDHLEAAGAMGIMRTILYNSNKNLPFHDPKLKSNKRFKDTGSSTMVNHFYEKLLHLHETMYTKSCERLARKRVAFMKLFLEEFLDEWEGKK